MCFVNKMDRIGADFYRCLDMIKDRLAASERPGGFARNHRKVRRQEWRVGLHDEELLRMLHLLRFSRYFDERLEALYRQGRLPGAFYSGRGQEGTHVGVATALRAEDSLFPTHRDLTAQFTKGLDVNRVMAQYWGRIDGYTRGRDGNSHIGDWQGNRTWTVMSHLPVAYPAACGAALAYSRKRRVAEAAASLTAGRGQK